MASPSSAAAITEQFLSLFERTILCVKSEAEGNTWKTVGRNILQQTIHPIIEQNKPLNMILPAFPFKSPNVSAKVLGVLPDAGEEVSLKVLDNFCCRVEKFYPAGAYIVVFSDGRVFNDLLGVDDATVAAYNQQCHAIVQRNNLRHISFENLESHVNMEEHPTQLSLIEEVMRLHLSPTFDVHAAVKSELQSTYLGFRSFLVLDLGMRWAQSGINGKPLSAKQVEEQCKTIAKQMIVRNQAFSNLVFAKFPNHLRLSIHAGNLQGPKWSISLINNKPNATTCASATPWHNVLVENADGEVFAVRRCQVDMNKYELVVREGQAWAFKEKEGGASESPLSVHKTVDTQNKANDCDAAVLPLCEGVSKTQICSVTPPLSPDTTISAPDTPSTNNTPNELHNISPSLSDKVKAAWKHLPVRFELLHPFGVMIIADPSVPTTPTDSSTPTSVPIYSPPSLFDVPADSMRELVCQYTTVSLRGFAPLSQEEFIEGVRRIGPLVVNPHGVVTDVREETDPKISVFTKEAMPVHFDGMFKIKMVDNEAVADVPFMQIFQCVVPPAPTDEGGITLFIDTRRILSTFPPEDVEKLRHLKIGYYMPPSGMFGGKWMYFYAVGVHPISGDDILRIHEPWPETKSAKFEIKVKAVLEEEEPTVKSFLEKIISMCYDDRFAYKQLWEKDDILFADNHAQLHTRTSYTTASRHLRRIHIQE